MGIFEVMPYDTQTMKNCIWCEKEINSSSKVQCKNCEQPYHRECIESEDHKDETGKYKCGSCQMEFTPLNCEKILKVPNAPKSIRSRSHKSIRSSSSRASRTELELKLLEDQHKLEMKQLQMQMDLERTFLAKKSGNSPEC